MDVNSLTSYYLTDILKKYLIYLKVIPENLKKASIAMLILLLTLDLMLMGKRLITDENFNPVKYLINKTWQFSYLIFIILNYSWLIESLREGFQKLASLSTGITLNSIYLDDPSEIITLGGGLAWGVIKKGVGALPSTWGYLFIALLIIIAFCMIAFGLVMTWIEYFFLIGISIIFVPFGILDTTEGYYKNIFKTIIGCNIKLFVMEFWLLLCEPIISNLKVSNELVNTFNIIHVTISVIVLALILLSMPRLASSILTGSPAMGAGQAMSSAIGGLTTATGMLTKSMKGVGSVAQTGGEGAKETALGSMKGAQRGGEMGAKLGSVLGPVGTALGATIGTAAGATVGGAYSGAKFATKKTAGAVKTAFTGKSNNSGSGKQEAVKNNIAAAKSPAKETSTESNSGVAATTGESRNSGSSAKEAEQGDTSTVSSVDTGAETDKSSKTISTGETRNSVSEASNDGKKSSESQNITSGSNTSVETKADTGEVRQGTAETKQSIGEIKEPKYNFYDTGGTTKVNGVEINEKKKK
ncbi:type IV secretion system protein [Fusobacterium ulcerans]|uniref:type IV secretion system protein n=1 Tax=Fusobacterium ulcerans TaxID=861 RepID=UPI002E7A65C1|nr:type IV secretion system protein [Fusobacterium ulcerans]MEE0137700.1 type IV secretion system protein [Fusobacterium ulcerans]